MTGEGWTDQMYLMWAAQDKPIPVLFFIVLILFGMFFVLNLGLAVISDSYEKTMEQDDQEEEKLKDKTKDKATIIDGLQKRKNAL